MVDGRGVGWIRWCSSVAVVAGALAGASPGWSVSGETPGTEGLFQARCTELPNTTPATDVVIPCDNDRQSCELRPEGPTGPSEGLAIGFCQEGQFPDPRPVVGQGDRPLPPLEEGVSLRGTSFGVDTGIKTGVGGATADVYCQTFVKATGAGVRSCRKIVACGPGGCPAVPPACDGLVTTGRDDCVDLKAQLAGTVTGDQSPNISFWIGMDIDAAPQPGFAVLSLCPGFTAQCTDGPAANGVTFEYQLPNAVINTPKCLRIGGRTIC